MRVAVTNQFRHVAGGAETYLRTLLPELIRRGYDVGLWHDVPARSHREAIDLPPESPICCVQSDGLAASRASLQAWKPDLIYSQSAPHPEWETALLATAPVIQFIHTYDGTCISGAKAWKFPIARPCERIFGWQCLAHYYPHRCGGLNPLTMIRNFHAQSDRLQSLKKTASIVTASDYIRTEFLKHGFPGEQVTTVGLCIPSRPAPPPATFRDAASIGILFCGRMVELKGGRLLLEAMPFIANRANRNLRVTFLGDGSERAEWESLAAALQRDNPSLHFQFLQWGSQEDCESIYRQHHLLAMPSIWPEPYGLSGPEGAQHGLPAVAFSVGGIKDWLVDGVNGHLAPADPPTAAGLSDAIWECIRDPSHYERLREASLRVADKLTVQHHLQALLPVFESAVQKPAA